MNRPRSTPTGWSSEPETATSRRARADGTHSIAAAANGPPAAKPRMAARVDPSDVVQEALTAAYPRLDEYLSDPPLPFYPWLRQFAWDRLLNLHRHHVAAQRRSVAREEVATPGLSSESVLRLSQRLMSHGTSPSGHLIRQELRDRFQAALTKLSPTTGRVLVMHTLEQMSPWRSRPSRGQGRHRARPVTWGPWSGCGRCSTSKARDF